MVETGTSDTTDTSAKLGAPSEKLVRASMAAGFAMVEALPDDCPLDEAPGAARRTWRALESYLARCMRSLHGRPPVLGVLRQ